MREMTNSLSVDCCLYTQSRNKEEQVKNFFRLKREVEEENSRAILGIVLKSREIGGVEYYYIIIVFERG